MSQEPPQPPPGSPARGPDDDGWPFSGVTPDWVDDEEWARMCAAPRDGDEPPPDPVQAFYDDPDSGPPPDWEQEPWETLTARAEADAAQYAGLMARLVAEGLEGCAHVRGAPPVPGIPEGPAAGFGQGRPLDAAEPGRGSGWPPASTGNC